MAKVKTISVKYIEQLKFGFIPISFFTVSKKIRFLLDFMKIFEVSFNWQLKSRKEGDEKT